MTWASFSFGLSRSEFVQTLYWIEVSATR
jgi:hypothetical protein